MLCGLFLHGIGPVPFASTIWVNYIHHFEHLHPEYLEMIYECEQSVAAKLLPKFKPFGEFGNCNGYAGFLPSLQYFRNFYVQFISSHAQEMDQYIAMLSAWLLQIDHSFKVQASSPILDLVYLTLLLCFLGSKAHCKAQWSFCLSSTPHLG